MADPRKLTPDMVRHLLCCVDLEPERERLRGHIAALEAELAAEKQAREEAEAEAAEILNALRALLDSPDDKVREMAAVIRDRPGLRARVFLDEYVARRERAEALKTQLEAWHGAFGTKQLTHALAERDRLQATVDKLPRTADGVPVVPGVELWSRPNRDGNCGIARHWLLDSRGMVWYGTMLRRPGGDAGSSQPIHRTEHQYSTREAAEAAKEPDDG